MKHYSLIGLCVCFLAAVAFSADVYVSPTGNDAAAGTSSDAPLATIAKARDKADELKASGPVTVYLMGGTFYLKEPVVFSPANSGTAAAPITYKNFPGQKPVISGGIKVTSAWTTSSGSIMKTTIDKDLKVDQLFLNGKRQVMARYPNYNESQMLQGSSSDALTKAGAAANPTEGPGYVRSLHSSMWGGESYIITAKSGSSVTPTWVGDNNRGEGMHSSYRMVENIYELLDVADEWFYRKSTGELFFWPKSGTDLNASTVELASLTEVLRFVGTSPTAAVKYIKFEGITLTHTFRSLFDGTGKFYEGITKSDWAMVRKGTVFMQNTENITIDHCFFDQIGGNGVFMSGYNRYNVVSNCDFEEAGASCVALFGLKSAYRCYNSWSGSGGCTDKTNPGPVGNEYPANCRIDNNMMNHLGRFEKQTSGFTCAGTEFDTIRHNTIHNIPRAGINFCDGCWGGHVVDYNWVYDCVKESGDHGPFNAWGRDRIEIFQDVASSKLDARNTTYVRNNRFEAPPGCFGIDLDDQATNYYQINNLCMGGGYKLQWNRFNTYLNGILLRGANVQFHGVWSSSSHSGARNIIFGAQNYTCLLQLLSGNTPASTKAAIAQWDSNVVYSSGGSPTVTTWSQNANCGSGVADWSAWKSAGLDQHSSTADPMFTDTQKTWPGYLPRGDFNPKTGSPALSLGFKPFPMDSFGVMGAVGPDVDVVKPPIGAKRYEHRFGGNACTVNYSTNRLTVAYNGAYRLFITSALGRTVAVFNGIGRSDFQLDAKRIGGGMYFAVVSTKNGLISRRFMVND
jgi:hypothetical protein